MRDFLTQLGSLYWWLSVVVVGILINIFSTLLHRKLDDRLSRVSAWWRSKSEKRKAKRLEQLAKLKSPSERVLLSLDVMHLRVEGFMAFLGGTGLAYFVSSFVKGVDLSHASLIKLLSLLIFTVLCFLLSNFFLFIGTINLITATHKSSLLRQARKTKIPES